MTRCVVCRVEFQLPVGQRKDRPCPKCSRAMEYSRLDKNMLLAKILVELERMNRGN